MKSKPLLLVLACLLLAFRGTAAVYYVDVNCANSTWPYADWSTAATDIQSAIDTASAGDQILVTNGVYQTGGEAVTGSLLNRVVVSKALTVQSVNGPAVTIIQGYQLPGTITGDGAIRCVYLTNSATLIGFTLTNGATRGMAGPSSERYAGGIYCRSASAIVSNCVIIGNAALTYGGGAYQGRLYNCIISANLATNGGGAYASYLNNCDLTGNSAYNLGGGAYSATSVSCTYTGNSALNAGGAAYSGTLTNCTLTGNSAGSGGGANTSGLDNCVLQNNAAVTNGGGIYSSTLKSCALVGNSALSGGGAYGGVLTNCTLTENAAMAYGGGSFNSTLGNCIVYYNTALINPNYDGGSTLNYCCTTPLSAGGNGNIASEPQFASPFRLSAASPCRGAGSANYSSGTDIDGESWASPPAMGCDEFYPATATGVFTVAIQAICTNAAIGTPLSFYADITGAVSSNLWSFGDGTFAANQLYPSHAWASAGNYPVVLRAYNNSNSGGISATVTVHVVTQQIYYVSAGGSSPVAPYSSWATAAKTIQDAVNAATVFGGQVFVTNGVYNSGGQIVYGSLSSRVAVSTPLILKSVNGPSVTSITGYQVAGTTNGNGAVRCVYLANGASLMGFTLTDGATRTSGDALLEQCGGGVWSAQSAGIISNCVLAGNTANNYGGGSYSGSLITCSITNNWVNSIGGGGYAGTFSNCVFSGNIANSGGGAAYGVLNRCTLSSNFAKSDGGGANYSTLYSCILTANSANSTGGGVSYCSLSSCTISNNSAVLNEYTYGGGAIGSNMTNCLLTANSSMDGGGAFGSFTGPSPIFTNCTLIGNTATAFGGGANSVALFNCIITGNSATDGGGGTCGCTLTNCIVASNSAAIGGGIASSTANNSSIIGNFSSSNGGGADSSTLNNCTVAQNDAGSDGGGGNNSTLNNCALMNNIAVDGGGSSGGSLNNCTLVNNLAVAEGGGSYNSTLANCIAYYNSSAIGSNYVGSSFDYSCTTPLPAGGTGNIAVAPLLGDAFHLSAGSPCRGAGSCSFASGTDMDGDAWANPPSIGCDEFCANTAAGPLSVQIQADATNAVIGSAVNVSATITGVANANYWDFGDGTVLSNSPYASHTWTAGGNYNIKFRVYNNSNPGGIMAAITVRVVTQPVYYVSLNSGAPVSPYNSWATAATNIQDAVNAATVSGAMVLVSNGVYATGGKVVYAPVSNRLAAAIPLVVQSVNGPAFTIISGNTGMRCAYLTGGSALIGFTLTNGNASFAYGSEQANSGAGVWCGSASVLVSNCVISGNSAQSLGGGAFSGNLACCVLSGNSAGSGGGAYYGTLTNCNLNRNSAGTAGYGGGAYYCVMNHCGLAANQAWYGGGAAYGTLNSCVINANSGVDGAGACEATLNNCLVVSNSADYYTGGVSSCTLNNCTLAYNGGEYYGGAYGVVARNSIIYNNTAWWDATKADFDPDSCTLASCCTESLPAGLNNITNAPQFSDSAGDFHLQSNSPCINSGNNAYVAAGSDLDGNPRTVGGTVDMGAYEFQTPVSRISYAWLQQFGLPITTNTDILDFDGTAFNVYQDWIAGLNPTNPASVLTLQPPVFLSSSLQLKWNSDTNHSYIVQRADGLGPSFSFRTIGSNILGQPGTTTFNDTTASRSVALYRVGTPSNNAGSPLLLQIPMFVPSSATITWSSVTNRSYFVQRSTNLALPSAFTLLESNLAGLPVTTSFVDTNAPATGPTFYRVGIQH